MFSPSFLLPLKYLHLRCTFIELWGLWCYLNRVTLRFVSEDQALSLDLQIDSDINVPKSFH